MLQLRLLELGDHPGDFLRRAPEPPALEVGLPPSQSTYLYNFIYLYEMIIYVCKYLRYDKYIKWICCTSGTFK